MNLSSYVPKVNVDQTGKVNVDQTGKGAGITTLDHSATTPPLNLLIMAM